MEKKNEEKLTAPKRYYEPKSSPLVPVYEWQEDEEGHHIRVQTGTKDLDAEIQLWKDACDIKVIVEKMMQGDAATINRLAAPMIYGDVNQFPQEVHPAAYAQGLQQLYENQPDAIKAKFPTYELFAKYFTNLTEAMINEMYAPKNESEVTGDVK